MNDDEKLTIYRRYATRQPKPDDSWFPESLSHARLGNNRHRRKVCGAYLLVALAVAEEMTQHFEEAQVLDVIQEANAGIIDAIESFSGHGSADFRSHVESTIRARLSETFQR